jgi:hypothetical protein
MCCRLGELARGCQAGSNGIREVGKLFFDGWLRNPLTEPEKKVKTNIVLWGSEQGLKYGEMGLQGVAKDGIPGVY